MALTLTVSVGKLDMSKFQDLLTLKAAMRKKFIALTVHIKECSRKKQEKGERGGNFRGKG